jgi:threonine synthase
MGLAESHLVCAGCGFELPAEEPCPFRCPRALPADDIDHVVTHRLDLEALSATHRAGEPAAARDYWGAVFAQDEPNPFLRYREFLHSWHAALSGGMSEDDWCAIVEELDRAVSRVDGRGFTETPFGAEPELARRLGLEAPGLLRVKNETVNVSGTHKGRHLMGVMIWLRVMEKLGRIPVSAGSGPPLAIASCGNAALAAAVLARAADRRLDVYIPIDARAGVVERLRKLGANLVVCQREPGVPGDPAYLAFRDAIEAGAIPFTCQGNENGLTIDGGKTLAFEIVTALRRDGAAIDRLFVQVGGGALASGVIQGLSEAHCLGLLERMPAIHAVQTEGGHPLVRAWQAFIDRFGLFDGHPGGAGGLDRDDSARLNRDLEWAATHRSEFMWPWETPPRSLAHGILDDETYDWLAVVRGMAETGGSPVVIDEALLAEAVPMAREATGIAVDATGVAGLAGAMVQVRRGVVKKGESLAVLFTGAER